MVSLNLIAKHIKDLFGYLFISYFSTYLWQKVTLSNLCCFVEIKIKVTSKSKHNWAKKLKNLLSTDLETIEMLPKASLTIVVLSITSNDWRGAWNDH